ncbi:MAG: PKD domain-containing protein, partial [Myxococcaceae bacterium]|nr:PKD domain-containing protein [Myxococcaceae bacterium]
MKRITSTLLATLLLAALPAFAAPLFPTQDANLRAAVGVPYMYNPEGAIRVTGTPPLSFSVCAGPGGFLVDAETGAVRWTPTAPGTTEVCVRVQDGSGGMSDLYLIISVTDVAPAPPTAKASATPSEGPAPLQVTLDASGSTAAAGVLVRSYAWHPSDASVTLHGQQVSHAYAVPGGYQARVVV